MLEKRRQEKREKEGREEEERRGELGKGRGGRKRGRQNQKQSEALRSRLPPRSKPSADHTDQRVENLPSWRVYRQRTKGCFRGF